MTILKADPKFRRRFFLLYGVAVVAGALLIAWMPALMKSYVQGETRTGLILELRLALFLIFVPFLAAAFFVYRVGRRVLSSGQFPPPGTKVLFDTAIVQGEPASRRGRAAVILAVTLLLVAVAGMFYVPYLLGQIFESP